jgi:hypothetical protein
MDGASMGHGDTRTVRDGRTDGWAWKAWLMGELRDWLAAHEVSPAQVLAANRDDVTSSRL